MRAAPAPQPFQSGKEEAAARRREGPVVLDPREAGRGAETELLLHRQMSPGTLTELSRWLLGESLTRVGATEYGRRLQTAHTGRKL